MDKKYMYEIEFLSREVSPVGVKHFGATGETTLRAIKENFKSFLEKNALTAKGATEGTIKNAKGEVIGDFIIHSMTF